jgi:type II secretory pathway component PulJ
MKGMEKMGNEKGYSFVEILLALFIGVLLLGAIYFSMATGQKSSAALERKVAAQQDIRAALQVMNLELAMASFNPQFVPGVWVESSDCSPSLQQENKGIQEATANSLTIQMDLGENGRIGDQENEILRYSYDATNERLTRERVLCGFTRTSTGPVDFLGTDPQSGQPRTVRVINGRLGIPVFRYFDGRGAATSNIPDIRRIDLTVAVETEEVDASTGQRRQMIYSTTVIPRNHAVNP